eukprot:s3501_g5.t1
MLAAAALVKDETDLVRSEDVNDQMRTNAMLSINNLRNGLGGRPDAATARSHATVLCVDFDLMAKNRSNTHTLWESLRNKGWYASAEATGLITADAPRKRSQPKRNEAIVNFINSMTEGLSIEFRAILENDVYQPGSGGTGETTGETVEGQREEYASAPPMPDVEMEDGGQPGEDNLESTDPNHEIHVAPRERAINSLVNLVDGTLEIYDRVLAFCVVCRDPRHTLAECTFAEGMVAEVNRGVEIMREAIFRRPKAKAGRRRGGETIASDLILIRYELSTIAGMRVTNRPGAFLICGVDIADVGPDSNDKVMELIETMSA